MRRKAAASWVPLRSTPRSLLAAVVGFASLLASASAVLPGPTTTAWSGAVSTLGVAGKPSARTLFISYASNWQYNLTSTPAILNSNYYAIRTSTARCAALGAERPNGSRAHARTVRMRSLS